LEQLRAKQPCFGQSATVSTWDTHNRHVLSLVRRSGNDVLVCLFNFTGDTQSITMDALEGTFTDLLTGETGLCSARDLPPYAYAFCLRQGNP
jgi:amylosucrase